MKKRVLSALLVLALLTSLLPASALATDLAEPEQAETVEMEEPKTEEAEAEEPETEEPEAEEAEPPETGAPTLVIEPEIHEGIGSIEDVFVLPGFFGVGESSTYGGSYFEQLDDSSKALYTAILASDLANGPRPISEVRVEADLTEIDVKDRTFTDATLTLKRTGTNSYSISYSGSPAEYINDTILAALGALLYDHPELSWLVNTQYSYNYTTAGEFEYPSGYESIEVGGSRTYTNQTVTLAEIAYGMSAQGYSDATTPFNSTAPNYDQANTRDKAAIDAAIAAAKGEIGELTGASRYEKVKALYDWVCNNVEYAHYRVGTAGYNAEEAAKFANGWRGYQTAYSALVERVTVCAGYSKAFKLLCDAYGIPCAIITGNAGGSGLPQDWGPHAWNYVQMDDGKWYGIDCTWGDQSTWIDYTYLLIGGKEFSATRKEGTLYSIYAFAYPELNQTRYKDSGSPTDISISYSPSHTAVSSKDVPGFAVPTIGQMGENAETVVTLTAAVTGGTSQQVEWSLSSSDAGITLTPGENNTAKLTIKNFAAAGKNPGAANELTGPIVTVTARCGTTSATQDLWIYVGYRTPKFVQILSGTTPIDTDAIAPGGTAVYTAKVYDQYGAEMTGQTVSWGISGGGSDITLNGSTVSVAAGAADSQTATLTATVGGKSGSIQISVNKLPQHTFTAMTDRAVTFGSAGFTQKVSHTCCGTAAAYSSSNTSVATVDASTGAVTIVGAGETTITATIAGTAAHAATTASYKLTVSQASITGATVTVTGTYTYNGSEQTPAVAVKLGTKTLVKDTDYTVSYTDNRNAGTATATVTGKGSYMGTAAKTFTIAKATLTPSIGGILTKVYDSTTNAPDAAIVLTGIIGSDDVTATASFAYDSANVGARTITASNITLTGEKSGNYSLSQTTATASGTITAKAQDAPSAPTAVDADIKDTSITLTTIPGAEYSRDGTNWQTSPTFTGLSPNTEYTFYARLKADNNHTASDSSAGTKITTKKTLLSGATVTVSGTFTYNGAAQTPAAEQVTVKLGSVTIASGQYTISASNNINAGTATVTITAAGSGNYSGSASGTFTISPATPVISWGTTAQELTYSGSPAAITAPTVALVKDEEFSGTITYSYAAGTSTSYTTGLPTNAGTYTIKASIAANGNYSAAQSTNTLALTIKKSAPTITFKDSYKPDRDYSGAAIANPTAADLTVTGAQFSAVKFAWTQDGKAATPTNAGTYTLTASIAETANTAAVSVTKEVVISKAAITVTPDAGQHKEYGAADPTLTYKITGGQLFGSDKLTGKLAYEGANVGKYAITQGTLAATANYTLTVASGVMFEITKPTLENATVTLSASSYIYDGAAKTPAVTVKKGTQTVDAGEYVITYSNTNGGAGNHTNAGTVTVTVSAKEDGNYHGSKSATFVINPKAVTAVVTAGNKVYDGTNSADVTAAVKESDLASGDSITIAGLTGTFNNANAGTNKSVTVNKTNASITGDGVGNYTVTIPATTTANITRATVTIAWASEAQTQTVGYTGSQAVISAPTVSAQNDVTVSVTPKYSYAAEGGSTFTSGLPTNAGTYTVRASIAESGNLTAASADMALTISPKTVGSPVITLSASTFVYDGQPKTPTVTIRDGGKVIPASEYEVVYEDNTDVGTATVTIKNVAGNYNVSGSATFTITERPLTGAAVNVSGTFSYTGAAHTPAPTVTLGGKTLVKDTDYTVGYAGNTNAGTATITITGKGNYTGEVKKTFTIAKATLIADGTGIASGTYEAKLSDLTIAGLTAKLGDTPVAGTWKLTGSAVPNVGDAGTYTATFTPTSGAGNYNTLTAPVKLSIAKTDYSGAKTAKTSAKSGGTATYALTALLPEWGVPGTVSVSGSIFEETPSISGGALSYKLKADAAVNSTGTITIPVTSTNYNGFNLTITVTVADKDVPTLTVSAITVTYNGEAVPSTAIRGTAKAGSITVPGTWAFAAGQGLTNAADSGVKTVIFTPNDAVMYAEVEGTVTVTINKATPTGAPKYTAISASGKTLVDAALTAPDGWPAGTLAWELPTDTGVTANTAYQWTFTPDNANYNTISGSITLWQSSSGGYVPSTPGTSGSSGTSSLPVTTTGQNSFAVTTTTTAAPTASTQGGKATTTVDTATGNEIVKQAVANKSEDVVIAPKVTGSVTKSEVSIPAATVGQIGRQTNASLTIATPVANVTIPNGGLGSLSSTGGAVTVTAEKMGNTVELSVTAGGRTVASVPGGLTLTVPMYYAAPGTVAVLVHDNGTRRVVRKSVTANGSVTIPLNGSAKLEIVDNSKYFYDVPATSWAADAVAFASSRELFNGTGANQFSPNLPMSRGMLATVLHNLESNPYQPFTGVFADVSSGAWYAEGVAWAAANGIVTGYGNGQFGPNDNITREQLAVMLWRYAGKPAATSRSLYFADAYRASDWALEALRWATQNGIINGKGNGILDPTGLATRAETAQMLKNFMERQ
ncbi:MAG: S-layer homology domain-containing protein [Oscillospiraceae bacterium]|nr:S-layer homology domain-containing protein [Oscillospiraceae bacterium]